MLRSVILLSVILVARSRNSVEFMITPTPSTAAPGPLRVAEAANFVDLPILVALIGGSSCMCTCLCS